MAATRTLQVEIIGDASQLEKSLGRAGQATKDFGKNAEEGSGHLSRLGGTFGEFGKTALAAGAGMFGAQGIIEGFKSAFDGGEKLEKSSRSLDAAIRATGGNIKVLGPQYESTAKAAARFGIDQATATQSLARATLLTGNSAAAQRAYQEALVISAATGKSLNSVLIATSKAQDGHTSALGRYGIQLDKTATGQQQLTAIMGRFGGQADANTSQTDILRAHLSNVSEEIGTKLVPIINDAIGFVVKNWPTISAVVGTTANIIKSVIENVIAPAIAEMTTIIKAIVAWVKDHWPEIKATVETTLNAVKKIIETILGAIKSFWDTWGSTITAIVKGVFNQIKIDINTVVTVIRGVIDVIDGLIHGRWGQVWNGLKTIVSGVFSGIVATIKNLVGTALSAAGSFGDAIFKGITGALKGLGNELVRLITVPINAIIRSIDSIGIPSGVTVHTKHVLGVPVPDGFDISYSHLNIPTLASGGIVNSPTLALIGEAGPEAVVPLGGRGFGSDLHIHFDGPVYADDRGIKELTNKIRRELYRTQSRNVNLGFS